MEISGCQGLRVSGTGEWLLNGYGVSFGVTKCSKTRQWWWLHNEYNKNF